MFSSAHFRRLGMLPSASVSRVLGGRRAKRAGDSWESLIECSQRDAQGRIVVLNHIPSGAKWIGPNKIIPVKSPFDFCGRVWNSGRAIAFDAKNFGESYASFPLDNMKLIESHQIAALIGMGSGGIGAIAGLLVRCGRMQDIRWLDWRFLSVRRRVQWSDPRWLILGRDGPIVPFRRLIQVYDLHVATSAEPSASKSRSVTARSPRDGSRKVCFSPTRAKSLRPSNPVHLMVDSHLLDKAVWR